jgi:anti-sigma regulatory factor (Ser/Thr protein kinase)
MALRHHAFVYESDEDYVAQSVEFLTGGLEAGESCIVANTRDALAAMREALGDDADQVTFHDVSATYTRPARAVAAYHRTFLEHLRRAPAVRAVADLQLGPAPGEWQEWAGYEAITNVAYDHLPVWVVCTYDANRLPDPILDTVGRTHAELGGRPSPDFEDPRELVRRLTAPPEPLPGLRVSRPGDDLERVRELLAREAAVEDVPSARVLELLVAGGELAANAVRHGDGIRAMRTGSAGGRFVCEVVDAGPGFDDPVAGYLAPRAGTGSGLWVARQLSWRLESFHSPDGFTVRLWL